jgi:uncharacterized membrane protein
MGTDIELGPRHGLSAPDRLERVADVVAGFVLVSLAAAIGNRLVGGTARSETILRAIEDDWRALIAGIALVALVAVVWGRHQSIHERVRVLDSTARAATIALLVALGALVPVGSLWMAELAGRPRRSDLAITVAIVALVLIALLLASWARFAADRALSDRWSAGEATRLRRSFTIALVLGLATAVGGYFVPVAGPFLLLAAALAVPLPLPLPGPSRGAGRPARGRGRRDDAPPTAEEPSDEE